jgi:hypothetical protein
MPIGRKIHQHLPLQDPPKFTQIKFLFENLATMLETQIWKVVEDLCRLLELEMRRVLIHSPVLKSISSFELIFKYCT